MVAGGAAQAQELRFMCYQDGVECDAWSAAFETFQAENPGITVVVDVVPYQAIIESLPVQLEVGEGPDLAWLDVVGLGHDPQPAFVLQDHAGRDGVAVHLHRHPALHQEDPLQHMHLPHP
jgi:ABC-type glycerol-3-phosphate transport system substrate-binding protein